jgi:galactokinase
MDFDDNTEADLRTDLNGEHIDYTALKTLPGLRTVDEWTIDADEGVCIFDDDNQ